MRRFLGLIIASLFIYSCSSTSVDSTPNINNDDAGTHVSVNPRVPVNDVVCLEEDVNQNNCGPWDCDVRYADINFNHEDIQTSEEISVNECEEDSDCDGEEICNCTVGNNWECTVPSCYHGSCGRILVLHHYCEIGCGENGCLQCVNDSDCGVGGGCGCTEDNTFTCQRPICFNGYCSAEITSSEDCGSIPCQETGCADCLTDSDCDYNNPCIIGVCRDDNTCQPNYYCADGEACLLDDNLEPFCVQEDFECLMDIDCFQFEDICNDYICENYHCQPSPVVEHLNCGLSMYCFSGECLPVGCDDGDLCTQDLFDPSIGLCQHREIVNCCLNDTVCADEDDCTLDLCIANRCSNVEIADCVSNPECTVDEDCVDDNPCTDGGYKRPEWCDNGTCVVVNTPNYGLCGMDGSGWYCFEGECSFFYCSDNDPCTMDLFDGVNQTCFFSYIQGCDDGDVCTFEVCDENGCHVEREPDCISCENDQDCGYNDVCTINTCVDNLCQSEEVCLYGMYGAIQRLCSVDQDCTDPNFGPYCLTFSSNGNDFGICSRCYTVNGQVVGCEEGQWCNEIDADYFLAGEFGSDNVYQLTVNQCFPIEPCYGDSACDDNDPCTIDHCVSNTCQYTTDSACIEVVECEDYEDCADDDGCTFEYCEDNKCVVVPLADCTTCQDNDDCVDVADFCGSYGADWIVQTLPNCQYNRCDVDYVLCENGCTNDTCVELNPECDEDTDCDPLSICLNGECVWSNEVVTCQITCPVQFTDVVVWWGSNQQEFIESGLTFSATFADLCHWEANHPTFMFNCTDYTNWGEGYDAIVECNQDNYRIIRDPIEGDHGKMQLFVDDVLCRQ